MNRSRFSLVGVVAAIGMAFFLVPEAGRLVRRLSLASLVAMAFTVFALASPPSAQAALTPAVSVSAPSEVRVSTSFGTTITLANNSTPPESADFPSANVTAIDIYPACSNTLVDCTGGIDAGAFTVSQGNGNVGGTATATGCIGTWSVAEVSPGQFRLAPPGGTLSLPTGATCDVGYFLEPLRLPTIDASPGTPGIQTNLNASASFGFQPGGPTLRPNGTDQMTVLRDQPAISTAAAPSAVLGEPIRDRAVLSDGTTPTGTITFSLYGPDDPTCTGPVAFTSTVPVNGNGAYDSGDFTPAAPGAYRWIAAYSGDADQNLPVAGPCNDPQETSIVRAATSISTAATPAATLGSPISALATLAGGADPSGRMTFLAFGPDVAICSGPAAFTRTVTVDGTGQYSSGAFIPSAPGTYLWLAAYSGDDHNTSAINPCGAPGSISTVTAQPATPPVTPPITPVVVTVTCKGQQATIVGTAGNDQLTGTPGRDVIAALGGDDKVFGLGGKDLICGGTGRDTLAGGKGKDNLLGQKGRDTLKGGGGKDLCAGAKGDDSASGCEKERSM